MSVFLRIVFVLLLIAVFVAVQRGKRQKAGGLAKGFAWPGKSLRPASTSQVESVLDDGAASGGGELPEPEKVAPGIERKMIGVGDRDVWYLEGGIGQPLSVLLLHGFAGDKEQWLGLMSQLLTRGFRVVAPDLLGCGQNDKDPEESYDIMSQMKLIRAFARRVGLKSAHLVGASMGGTVAAAYAYAAADFARSLTMIEPFCLRVPRQSELDLMVEQGRNPLIIATPAAYDNLIRFLCARPVSDRFKRERAERLAADRQVNLKIWHDVCEGERAHLLDLFLPELEVRTLAIQGEKSKIVHPVSVEIISGMMKNVQTVIIPECGHLPMIEKLAETVQHLTGFLLPPAETPAAASTES